MPLGIGLVHEIATDFHIPKDVIQVPLELSRIFNECPLYLITRPNVCQTRLPEYFNIIYLGEANEQNNELLRNGILDGPIASAEWYQKACLEAANYADILMLFPYWGLPVRGAIRFWLANLYKGRRSAVYLKLDAEPKEWEAKRQTESTKGSVLKSFANRLKYFPIKAISAESSLTLEIFNFLYPELKNKTFLVKNCPPQSEIFSQGDMVSINSKRELVFLNVGRLSSYQKAIDVLLSAWIIASPHCMDWKLYLVGECDSSFHREWTIKLQEAKLEHTVHWMGSVTNRELLWRIYKQASIFVISSRYEAASLAFIEAITAGLAVVSTSVGDVPSTLGENDLGIVPVEDIQSLAKTMILFANDKNIRENQILKLRNEVQTRTWNYQLKPVAYELQKHLNEL